MRLIRIVVLSGVTTLCVGCAVVPPTYPYGAGGVIIVPPPIIHPGLYRGYGYGPYYAPLYRFNGYRRW